MYRTVENRYDYELSDHLGNVRAVISGVKVSGRVDVLEYADYYAMGSVARSGGTMQYRYGYQGQYAEKDGETGWNSFELRQYDAVIGRWLSPDPYGQYDSPYVGMGNDWTMQVDEDGGVAAQPRPRFPRNRGQRKGMANLSRKLQTPARLVTYGAFKFYAGADYYEVQAYRRPLVTARTGANPRLEEDVADANRPSPAGEVTKVLLDLIDHVGEVKEKFSYKYDETTENLRDARLMGQSQFEVDAVTQIRLYKLQEQYMQQVRQAAFKGLSEQQIFKLNPAEVGWRFSITQLQFGRSPAEKFDKALRAMINTGMLIKQGGKVVKTVTILKNFTHY